MRSLVEADTLPRDQWPDGVHLARLITKGETGSAVLLGACWLQPAQVTRFDLRGAGAGEGMEPQEIYYILAGRIRVSYEGRKLCAEAGSAVFFPPGRELAVEAVGEDEVFLIYTALPAPR
ncbi:MAG TPA: cupin domain-containing protein [Solirubrobacteraceae bacterium]